MEPEDMPVYTSIYERPIRKRGRPNILTDEEKSQRLRDNAKQWYNNNSEYKKFKNSIYSQNNKERILEQQRIYRANKKNNNL